MQDNDDVSELDIATREVLILRCNLIQLASEYIKINPLKNTRIYTDLIHRSADVIKISNKVTSRINIIICHRM